jgi:hypothetical protein
MGRRYSGNRRSPRSRCVRVWAIRTGLGGPLATGPHPIDTARPLAANKSPENPLGFLEAHTPRPPLKGAVGGVSDFR